MVSFIVHECTRRVYGSPAELVRLLVFVACTLVYIPPHLLLFALDVTLYLHFSLFLLILLSRPKMPTGYLLFWYSCYALHLFRDAGPSTSSQHWSSLKQTDPETGVSTRRFVLFQSPYVYIDLSFTFRDSPVSIVHFWDLYSFYSSSVLVTSRFWEGSLFVYIFLVCFRMFILLFAYSCLVSTLRPITCCSGLRVGLPTGGL